MIYHDVEQGSPEWHALRLGLPTASRFDMILTPKTEKPSGSQKKLIYQLIGERFAHLMPERAESFTSRAMQWGRDCEAEARRYYCLQKRCEVCNGGFCLTDDGRFGASPDFLIGEEGVGELKCPSPETHVEYLDEGILPSEYRCQVHGELIVSSYAFCDFMSYCRGFEPFIIRVFPDAFTVKLRAALEEFDKLFRLALAKFAPHDAPPAVRGVDESDVINF